MANVVDTHKYSYKIVQKNLISRKKSYFVSCERHFLGVVGEGGGFFVGI
jgi:hypothetical protein